MNRSSFAPNSNIANPFSNVYWNGLVSVVSNVLQSFFSGVFFVIVARHFGPVDFSNFVVANSLYQVIVLITPLGLMHYFVREYTQNESVRSQLTKDIIVVETYMGLLGSVAIVLSSALLGYNHVTMLLTAVLALNALFDNIFYCVRTIFVAENRQSRLAIATVMESVLKLALAISIFLFNLSLLEIVWVLVFLRCFVLIVAIRLLDKQRKADFANLLFPWYLLSNFHQRRLWDLVKKAKNFSVIATVSLVYWRLNVLLLSKLSTPLEISYYEVGSKMCGVVQVFIVYYLLAFYPVLAKSFQEDRTEFLNLAQKTLSHLGIFSVAVTIPAVFAAPQLVQLLFGPHYYGAASLTAIMFLSIIPTSFGLVQAYVLLASHNEKLDMWLNLGALLLNGVLCPPLIGLHGGAGAALAIVISYSVFCFAQQVLLFRRGIHLWKMLPPHFWIIAAAHFGVVYFVSHINTTLGVILGQIVFWTLIFYSKLVNPTNFFYSLKNRYRRFLLLKLAGERAQAE